MTPKLSTENNVYRQVVNTVACTVKVKVPDTLAPRLNTLLSLALPAIDRMLRNRTDSSSRHYPELPCVISKSLIAKYQRNYKCRKVSNPILPVCGDKERQVKLEGDGVRIPAIFGKQILPVFFPRTPIADEQGRRNVSVELFHREGVWYCSLSYRTLTQPMFEPTGMVGVDRNSVGHVATLADPQTGRVLHLGFNPAPTKKVWRQRKSNLQQQGKKRLLARIRRKQSRRTKHENHLVSKAIVNYAATHRRAIVVESLENVRSKTSKIRSYVERSQWSFYQLLQFIHYKAALLGVQVFEVNPAYSSQECSRCHSLTKPAGKFYRCSRCGHNDHRDANAAFTLAQRVMPIGGVAQDSEGLRSGLLVAPFLGTVESVLGAAYA
jgi:IS605 OrfB family transposase